jgi:PEGA domain
LRNIMQPDLDALNSETTPGADEQAAAARIRLLLDKGPLAEAEEACKQALTRFPESDSLRALGSDIQQKETAVRHLLDRGEECLLERNFDAAGEFFTGACHLLPLDGELTDYIVGLLRQHAQTALEKDWESADAALALAARIQPESLASPFLADALEEKKHQAQPATETFRAEVEDDTPRPAAPSRLKAAMVMCAALVVLVAASVFAWKAVRARFAERPAANTTAETGTLTIRTNVRDAEVFINDRKYAGPADSTPLEIKLPPDTYQIRAAHAGYTDFGPVVAAVKKNGETALDLELNPKPAMLKIHGAEPGTHVTVDGVLVGSVVPGTGLTGQLSPGAHAIELAREGYLPRKIVILLAPGEDRVLSGSDVELHSTDASLRLPELPDLPVNGVDKESGAYADVVPAVQAQVQPEIPSQPAPAQTDQTDWAAVNKSSKPALMAFLAKYSSGPRAEEATGLIANLDREAAAVAAQRAEEAAWKSVNLGDRSSINTYLAQFPSSEHRGEADRALADIRSAELSRADSAAIVALIGRFANAWSAKDMDSILAMQQDLDRQTLKSQFAPVKEIQMKISLLSPPQIAGAQATVICRRQADETFLDGSTKQNPESVITYLLSKRTGAWRIDGTR